MKNLGGFLLILGIMLFIATTSYLGDTSVFITPSDIICYLLEFFLVVIGVFLMIHLGSYE